MINVAWLLPLLVAQADVSPLALALARAQGREEVGDLRIERAKKTATGWVVSWGQAVGEGGNEECTADYGADGSLHRLDCELEYVSHSLGPENTRTNAHAIRTYSGGALKKVIGWVKSWRLSDGVVKEKRKLTRGDDEVLAQLSKPLLTLDPALRP